MTYKMQNELAHNPMLTARVAQAAAGELGAADPRDPDEWTLKYRRDWAAAPGWDAAWASAQVSHEDDEDPYDPGADEAVITDGMILSQVQAMLAAQPDPEP